MMNIPDIENPEWTEDDFKKARPASEILPQLVRIQDEQRNLPAIPVSIRLSPEIVAYFKSQGKGWQSKVNEVLREYVAAHSGD